MQSDPCYVFGLALDGNGGAVEIDDPAASTRPQWLHIDYSSATAEGWLRERGLPSRVVDSLVRPETRPRTLAAGDGLLIVLRGINTNPDSDPEDMVSLRIWLEPGRLITVRQRRLLAVQDVRSYLLEGHGPNDLPMVLVALIQRLADRIATYVDELEDQLGGFEVRADRERPMKIRSSVVALRRTTAVVRRYLAPQRDALEAAQRLDRDVLAEERQYEIREQSDRITRYVEDLDLVRERALVLQEELQNRLAEEQNARMYVLSIVAAIFLPISFITGMFGMNVAGLPGLETPGAFWVVAGAMAAISVGIVLLLRLRHWL